MLKRNWSTPESAVRLWYGIFGGGAKKPKPNNPSTSSALSTTRNFRFRVLKHEEKSFVLADSNADTFAPSSVGDRHQSTSLFARKIMIPNAQQQQTATTSYIEVFIPPRASIVNYFMAKVNS